MTTRAKILIFDSGSGGLSIMDSAINKYNLSADFFYCNDYEYFPYSSQKEKDIISRVVKIITKNCAEISPNIIIIACNTASTLVLEKLRSIIKIPIIGVVPAVKPACQISATKVIGLIATPITIQSYYFNNLLKKFASQCEVKSIASTELVKLSENKILLKGIDLKILKKELAPLKSINNLDTIVLACTHFHHIKTEISQNFGEKVKIIDCNDAIIQRIIFFLYTCKQEGQDGLSRNTLISTSKDFLLLKNNISKSLDLDWHYSSYCKV